jgi:DNA-binding Lrp family transcriptional regulator
MQQNSKELLSQDEMRILDVLKENARERANSIAEKCGFSRQKVEKIIKHLEDEQIIWGYSATTGAGALDPYGDHFILFIKRTNVPLDESMKKEVTFEKLDDYLPKGVKIENIIMVHGGGWNAMITFYAPDLLKAREMISRMNQRIGKYFGEYLLIRGLFPIRKNGLKNPRIGNLVDYI